MIVFYLTQCPLLVEKDIIFKLYLRVWSVAFYYRKKMFFLLLIFLKNKLAIINAVKS
jgi:hypothetical protein